MINLISFRQFEGKSSYISIDGKRLICFYESDNYSQFPEFVIYNGNVFFYQKNAPRMVGSYVFYKISSMSVNDLVTAASNLSSETIVEIISL